ncbi:MAG: hypothetical protein AAF573_10650, partial [Bacteroidota bacterium]
MILRNLFDEIPNKEFHSCILTTYSFDFHFMEEKVRRQLQAKGIINISILVDEQMLESSLGNLTGNLSRVGKSYSISSISTSSLFHPKINLFVGENKALILLGSGNITATGFGKNHEIWSSVFIDGLDDPNLPFFGNAGTKYVY